MNFSESESYLLSLGNEVSAMKLGLENIRRLLAALGDPKKKYLKVQVAGTNGKGSVCAFLNSICLSAGVRTGMYTSPHLNSITERIQIDGVEIDEAKFAALATRVLEASEKLFALGEIESIPTFFEQVTAIALLAFAEAEVELAILETGLGGRLDATTAADAEIAAITRIDIDHQKYLGETIEEIAVEKAAIIHRGSRVVVGEQIPEARAIVLQKCREAGVVPVVAGGNTSGSECALEPTAEAPSLPVGFQPPGLAGRHQLENAKIAVAVSEILMEHFTISKDSVRDGIINARHPGRLEWIGPYLLDGAHNIGGARALRTYLDEFVDRPITMIFGAMSDKDVGEIGSILFSRAVRLILTQPNNSRAARAEDLLQFASDADRVFVTPNALAALEKAQEISNPDDVVVVTGSLYLVGEVRRMLMDNLPEN